MKSARQDQPVDAAAKTSGIAAEPPRAWHTLPADEVARALRVDLASGLTDAEATSRRRQFGSNSLTEARGRPVLAILVDQFKSLIVALLFAATVVAFVVGDNIEAFAILVVIVLNAAVGFLTEWKAEQALTALKKQAVATAHVLRGGQEHQLPALELVPGDVVILAAGSRVPADGRIVESARLQVEEAALTASHMP